MSDLSKPSEAESEFVEEMQGAQPPPEESWHNFDPDFRQKDIERLIRRGWFEKRIDELGYREYRWTTAGREALSKASA